MTTADLITYSGYLFTMFISGYVSGFLMRTFIKAANHVR